MSIVLRSFVISSIIVAGVYQVAEGQGFPSPLSMCNTCQQTQCVCTAPTQTVGGPVAQSCTKTCTTVHPVVETRYCPQQYLTSRTECRTAMRQEAYTETVPQTCVQNVTRDEGCYQLVWVPKPVTRQVAHTVYRQQMRYRNVPYQYSVQVPQLNTRMVPQQSVRYVQRTQTFTEPMRPVCAPMVTPQAVFAPQPQTAAFPPPIARPQMAPTCAAPSCAAPGGIPVGQHQHPQYGQAQNPQYARTQAAPYGQAQNPQYTQAQNAPYGQWSQVTQRADAAQQNVQGAGYLSAASAAPSLQTPPATPSAAAVWQANR